MFIFQNLLTCHVEETAEEDFPLEAGCHGFFTEMKIQVVEREASR